MINQTINQVVQYGLSKNLLTLDDQVYVMNRLLALFKVDNMDFKDREQQSLEKNIDFLLKYAIKNNFIKNDSFSERIKFEARIMDCLMPRPSELNKMFRSKYKKSPQQATKFFHDFSYNSHYIKTKPIEDNLNFLYASQYGDLEMIVNTLKPDAMHGKKRFEYLNHREVSISVNNEKNAWTMQFMPYPVLEEHCLISRKDHLESYNNDRTFEELIDFINKFPQYFIMSDMANALSNNGILPYHYFQAGKHVFPIESAEVIGKYKNGRVRIEVLNWPVSAIRLIGNNENKLLDLMHDLYLNWTCYSNEALRIKPQTEETIHNIIDVFVKLDGSKFNVYMVFKNNRKSEDYLQGIFQPNKEILFSDFGILEDLGVFGISKSLYSDLDLIKKILLEESDISDYPNLKYLKTWINMTKDKERPADLDLFLKNQLSELFKSSLEATNVFKFGQKEDFIAFVGKAV
ncbi:MAG: hypothetical protein PF513_01780 [Tenericutes bacterium]|jgi:UDPglucose--hexose-1-phosphate uridylyltransferase|nr:hypothetical protein [Mycoplasmatota bacterium]